MMDIYIVIYKSTDYYPETHHRSYEEQNDALLQAIEYASNKEWKLDSIMSLNINTKTVTGYDLVLEKGQFTLTERKEDD